MNTEQFDDLKQFITATVSQTEQRLRDEVTSTVFESERRLRDEIQAAISGSEQRLRDEMADGFAGVGEAIETSTAHFDGRDKKVQKRLTRLERLTA